MRPRLPLALEKARIGGGFPPGSRWMCAWERARSSAVGTRGRSRDSREVRAGAGCPGLADGARSERADLVGAGKIAPSPPVASYLGRGNVLDV